MQQQCLVSSRVTITLSHTRLQMISSSFPLILKVCLVDQSVPHRQPYGVHQGDHSPHILQRKLPLNVNLRLPARERCSSNDGCKNYLT